MSYGRAESFYGIVFENEAMPCDERSDWFSDLLPDHLGWRGQLADALGYAVAEQRLGNDDLDRIVRDFGCYVGIVGHEAEPSGFYVAVLESIVVVGGELGRGDFGQVRDVPGPAWGARLARCCALLHLPWRSPSASLVSIGEDGGYTAIGPAPKPAPLPPMPTPEQKAWMRLARLVSEQAGARLEWRRKLAHERRMRHEPMYRLAYERRIGAIFNGLFERDVQ